MANPEKVPYFIKIRGCINCSASKTLKEKTGKEYGFDHELMLLCIFYGCDNYGANIMQPYYDPAEIVRLAKKRGDARIIDRARELCLVLKEKFGEFYEKEGIPIDEIIDGLDEPDQEGGL